MIDMSKVHESWCPLFKVLVNQVGFKKFQKRIATGKAMCPHKDDVFAAFEMPVDKVQLVIVGQDPYPKQVYATGLAFGIRPETLPEKHPLSLRLLIDRVQDMMPDHPAEDYFDQTLRLWQDEGALLMNRYLSCEPGEPGSHSHFWDEFTKAIAFHLSQKKPDIVWYLLGRPAKQLKEHITSGVIIEDNHPAAVRFGHKFEGKFKEISEHLPNFTWMLPF